MKTSVASLASLLAKAALTVVFLVQLYTCANKLANRTILPVTTKVSMEAQELPGVTICPAGPKNTHYGEEVSSDSTAYFYVQTLCAKEKDQASREACLAAQMWSAGELFVGAHQSNYGSMFNATSVLSSEVKEDAGEMEVAGYYVPHLLIGNCFSLDFNGRKQTTGLDGDIMILRLVPGKYRLYLHDRKVVPVYRDEWGDTVPVENVAMDLRDKAGYRGFLTLELETRRLLEGNKAVPCQPDPDYNFKTCWVDMLLSKAGCQLPWSRWGRRWEHVPNCTKFVEDSVLMEYDAAFTSLFAMNMKNMSAAGCPPPCAHNSYRRTDAVEDNFSSRMNDFGFGTDDYGSVWVVLAFRSDVVHVMEESLLYDFSSFLGEAGGSLGLFLGLSFANAVDLAKWVAEVAVAKMTNKANKKTNEQPEQKEQDY